MHVIARLAVAMHEGVKYGYYNYRVTGKIKASTYYSALLRHVTDYMEGNDIDKHSPAGLSNLEKAMACLTVWIDSIHAGTYDDDRPPRINGHSTWLDDLNAKTVMITELTPNKTPAYTQSGQLQPYQKFETDKDYEEWRDRVQLSPAACATTDYSDISDVDWTCEDDEDEEDYEEDDVPENNLIDN